MSYKNGDKSRENRLRKARIAQREKIRQVRAVQAPASSPKAKQK